MPKNHIDYEEAYGFLARRVFAITQAMRAKLLTPEAHAELLEAALRRAEARKQARQ